MHLAFTFILQYYPTDSLSLNLNLTTFLFSTHFAFSVTFTSLSLPHVPRYPHPPNFRDVSPISPPTHLRLCHTLPSLSSLPNPATNP